MSRAPLLLPASDKPPLLDRSDYGMAHAHVFEAPDTGGVMERKPWRDPIEAQLDALSEPQLVLPEQQRRAYRSGEQELALAVIEAALEDARIEVRGGRLPPERRGALDWIKHRGPIEPSTFEFWCQVANLEAGAVRERIDREGLARSLERVIIKTRTKEVA